MALVKGVENVAGVVVTYWKVTGINLAFTGKRGSIMIGGYLSKETRDADKEQVTLRQVNLKHELFDAYFNNESLLSKDPRQIAYKYLLDNDLELSASTNC